MAESVSGRRRGREFRHCPDRPDRPDTQRGKDGVRAVQGRVVSDVASAFAWVRVSSPPPGQPPPAAVTERAAAPLRFAEEAYAALAAREPDPVEEAERAVVCAGRGSGRSDGDGGNG
jgi:hypothetical protein